MLKFIQLRLRQSILRNMCRESKSWLSSDSRDTFFEKMLSQTDKTKLLYIFNNFNEEKLQRNVNISPSKAIDIIQHREKLGTYKSVSDILSIPRFEALYLAKLCTSLINIDVSKPVKKKPKMPLSSRCTPKLTKEVAESVNRVCSLDVKLLNVYYSVTDKNLKLRDWGQMKLFERVPFCYDHLLFHEKVSDLITNSIPKADIYLMEYSVIHLASVKQAKMLALNNIAMALVATLLNDGYPQKDNKLYMMRQEFISREFNIDPKNKRKMSYEKKILKLNTADNQTFMDVYISHFLTDKFRKLETKHRDPVVHTLLMNLAFHRLCTSISSAK